MEKKYYIDDECINCGLCVEIAPNNIFFNEITGIQNVKKQPVLPDEINQLEEALESCPTESIKVDNKS